MANDLLSIACQTVLRLALSANWRPGCSEQGWPTDRWRRLQKHFFEWCGCGGRRQRAERPVGGRLPDRLSNSMPPLAFWENEEHEIQVALRMMAKLVARGDDTQTLPSIVGDCPRPAGLPRRCPLNRPTAVSPCRPRPSSTIRSAASFGARLETWRPMSFSAFIADLVTWCLNTHLRVALRKLRYHRALDLPHETFRTWPGGCRRNTATARTPSAFPPV